MGGQLTLAAWRKERGLSQRKLAALLSACLGRTVHQQSVYQWESGVMPGADVAEAIRIVTDGHLTSASFVRGAAKEENPCQRG